MIHIKKTVLAAICLLALLSKCGAENQAPPASAGVTTFDQRRKACFDEVWNDFQATENKLSAHNAFWRAEVLFEMGKIPEARRLANRGLDQLVPGNKENRWIYGGNSGFTAWPGMDCYVRDNRFFDDALKERFRKIYTGAVFYKRLTTSNHTIMAAVTRYLATATWGEDAFIADPFYRGGTPLDTPSQSSPPPARQAGTYFAKNDPSGVKFCQARIAGALAVGPGEYASRPYGSEDVLPILTLAECAPDPEIRRTALAAYEYCLAQLAPAYLHGNLATFSTRSYPDVMTETPWGIAALCWMYFGGVSPDHLAAQWGLRAMTSTFRLPHSIEAAGTGRSLPYVFRSRANGWALTHFVNKSYILFCRSPKIAHPKVLGQNYPCGVMWDEPDPGKSDFLWITNPAADDNTPGSKTNPTGIHTHGVTNYEQQVQLRDAMLSVYNIPQNWRNPYVLGFVPGGFQAMINESAKAGRIFLDYGSVLLAISASHPFDWNPDSGIRAPAGKTPAGCSEFRVMATQCAVAIETASPEAFPGGTAAERLAAFHDQIMAKSSIHCDGIPAGPRGTYTGRDGHVISCAFDGEDTIDGKVVDYSQWPMLECPWYFQAAGGAEPDFNQSNPKADRP